MKNILGTYLEKDGFYILAKRNFCEFLIGQRDYVIHVRGRASLYILFDRDDELNKFMERLAIELERIEKLSLSILIDCLVVCANAMENSNRKEDILNYLASYM